jgi:hypothetical protein
MKLSFWSKFAVLMLALVLGQCVTWLIEFRSHFGFASKDSVAASKSMTE